MIGPYDDAAQSVLADTTRLGKDSLLVHAIIMNWCNERKIASVTVGELLRFMVLAPELLYNLTGRAARFEGAHHMISGCAAPEGAVMEMSLPLPREFEARGRAVRRAAECMRETMVAAMIRLEEQWKERAE